VKFLEIMTKKLISMHYHWKWILHMALFLCFIC